MSIIVACKNISISLTTQLLVVVLTLFYFYQYMLTEYTTKRMIISIFTFMALVCIIIFLTYNRALKQDDGWYLSWVLRWMHDIGNTNIQAYWDYTDTNDVDAGCSFVYTITEGIYYSIFGIGVAATKALNAIEAIILCSIIYLYIRKENRLLGLLTVVALIGWNMFHIHFFNRPELPASIVAMAILYIFNYRLYSKRQVFFGYFLLGILLDLHPLSLFLVAGMAVKVFIKVPDKRLNAVLGGITGLVVYLAGNYWVNGTLGPFSGLLGGSHVGAGDHYIPILSTGISDILQIAKDRFTFVTKSNTLGNILKVLCYLTIFGTAVYLLIVKRLFTTKLVTNSIITYFTFIILSTFLSEATSNGFRLYHAIAFGLMYFAILYTIFNTAPVKYLAYIGLIPFMIYAKDAMPLIKQNYHYHEQNRYYREFQEFNDRIPEHTKVLMRPTHAFFTYNKQIRFDYTYGLLRYMHKNNLTFKQAVIKKQYNYLVLDDLFKTEFFTDVPSPFRTSNAPYYLPLRTTGLTSTEFNNLIATGFLSPIASLYDAFAGNTVLYKVDLNK